MDWNFKPAPGYLSEFDQEATIPTISPIDGSITFGSSGSRTKGEFSFDLKLGQVSNNNNSNSTPISGFEIMNQWTEAAGSKTESSSASGSSKRARASGNGTQTVFCLVDGCNADLSNCREYHRRHKVCEVHSKTPVVTINGHKQRFCQQCSRFHSLEEFDEGKRSCRKRLDGHNRRRRKPQPDQLSRPASFLSNFQSTKLLQFSSSHVFPSTTVVNPSWANAVSYDQHQQLPSPAKQTVFHITSPSSSYKVEKQFSFLRDENPCNNQRQQQQQPLHRTYSSWSGGDSDCALSLLSSPSQTQSSPNIGLSHHHAVQQPGGSVIPLAQPPTLGSEPHVDSVLVSNNSRGDGVVYGSGLFQSTSASDGSVVSGNDARQTFPFHWE